jgi:hypothetical protein
MKNKVRIMSLVISVGLLTVAAIGCGQSSNSSDTGNTPSQSSQQNSMAPSVADTNAVPSAGMNTNSPAVTSTNAP